MGLSIRRILAICFLVLHGGVSALGPSLHAFPGLDHARPLRHESTSTPDSPSTVFNAHDDCPVCHLLTHGQLPRGSDPGIGLDKVSRSSTPEVPVAANARPCLLSHPRAPPRL